MVEPTTIFLSACVIVLIYLVYYTYTFNATLLLTSISPANYPITITPPVPAVGSIAASFTYSIWINVNDWTVNQRFYKNILSYGTSTYISLEPTTNNVDVALKTSSSSPIYTAATVIKNIPLQTWVHLAFSLSGTTLDSYVNGRLVTTNLVGSGYIVPTVTDTIILGGAIAKPSEACVSSTPTAGGTYVAGNVKPGCSCAAPSNPGFSGYVTQFQYSQTASDPQTIWNIFNQGNGTSMFSNFFGNYGLSVALTNNGVAQNTISI